MMITAVAIDDEPLALKIIEFYCQKISTLKLIKTFTNPLTGLDYIQMNLPTVVFLDIEMPDLNGINLAQRISNQTQIIFTTAYAQFALKSYEIPAVDYLLKPFSLERFIVAVEKVRNLYDNITSLPTEINLKIDGFNHNLKCQEILYFEAKRDYVKINFIDRKKPSLLTRITMKNLENLISNQFFIKVHRSFIVNKIAITKYNSKYLFLSDQTIPISKNYITELKKIKAIQD